MSVQIEFSAGVAMLAEMQQFGAFTSEVQRYICRSLDLAFDPIALPEKWARDEHEASQAAS